MFGCLMIALSVNAYYYSRFRYELNAATATNTALLCAIADQIIHNFTCPKPIYYDSYIGFANELKTAYKVIIPIDIVIVVLVLILVFVLIIKKWWENKHDDYTQI
jgi:hypothetical protein